MHTRKAGIMIIAFGLFIVLAPATVISLYIPATFIPLFFHPLTLTVLAFGLVFLSLGIYFFIIGKRQV